MKILLTLFCVIIGFSHVNAQDLMILKSSGKVVIGDTTQITTPGTYNLYVQNGVMTEKVKVAVKTEADWRDNSFGKTPSLQEVEKEIATKSHLYNMPSSKELVKQGYDVREMDAHLTEQIEWLWQHLISLAEENKALRAELDGIKTSKRDED
ncbi:hypothetical protein [Portibacter marinus]|uniref:hypothetical protein n=1 Tax=Portibacter marinus TaxID=2898660 RepID=UPI001F22CD04|nr:hypothetical protein [Portibacter marinus]